MVLHGCFSVCVNFLQLNVFHPNTLFTRENNINIFKETQTCYYQWSTPPEIRNPFDANVFIVLTESHSRTMSLFYHIFSAACLSCSLLVRYAGTEHHYERNARDIVLIAATSHSHSLDRHRVGGWVVGWVGVV